MNSTLIPVEGRLAHGPPQRPCKLAGVIHEGRLRIDDSNNPGFWAEVDLSYVVRSRVPSAPPKVSSDPRLPSIIDSAPDAVPLVQTVLVRGELPARVCPASQLVGVLDGTGRLRINDVHNPAFGAEADLLA